MKNYEVPSEWPIYAANFPIILVSFVFNRMKSMKAGKSYNPIYSKSKSQNSF